MFAVYQNYELKIYQKRRGNMIPKQLQNYEFRFCKIEKKSKIPVEQNWQATQNYAYDDPTLLQWVQDGGNYGCIGGYGNLRFIDCDKSEFAEIIKSKLPNTFIVRTGKGGYHFYIISDYSKNHVFIKEYGELRSTKYQVVGAGSTHPNGNKYEILNDSPITAISHNELLEIIKPYLRDQPIIPIDELQIKELQKNVDQTRSGQEYREILKLIRRGFSKEIIFAKMNVYAKWSDAHPTYREITYTKALNWVSKQKGVGIERAIKEFENYLDMADRFIQIQPLYYDKNKLWWLWDFEKNSWILTDEIDLMNLIDQLTIIKGSFRSEIKSQILESLRRKARLNTPENLKNTWVQFKNKIIDISTDEEFEVDNKYFAVNPIPWEIGKSDDTPTIDRIFEEWVGIEYKQTLYELIAFSISPNYFLHRVFCLVGSGLNGKTKFLNLLKKFVGENNICSTELDLLLITNSRFESAKLYKKLVSIMGETNFNTLNKTSLLKKLTGQDTMGFEFKGKTPFDAENYAKLIIATNSLPITHDKTVGFYRRWLIIEFNNTFTEEKDILQEIPEQEYRNLSKKCVRILKDLWKTRRFTNEGTIEERAARFEYKSNPLLTFLNEFCIRDPNKEIPSFEFLEIYNNFLAERGYRKITDIEAGFLLRNNGYERKLKKIKRIDGGETTRRYILGVEWNKKVYKDYKEYSSSYSVLLEKKRVDIPILSTNLVYQPKSLKIRCKLCELDVEKKDWNEEKQCCRFCAENGSVLN